MNAELIAQLRAPNGSLGNKAADALEAAQAEIERLRALAPLHNGKSAEHWNKLAVMRYQENCVIERERDQALARLAELGRKVWVD